MCVDGDTQYIVRDFGTSFVRVALPFVEKLYTKSVVIAGAALAALLME